jgi:hypothetical protein
MNIETKTVRGDLAEHLKFGWKHTEDNSVRSGRHHYTHHVLARDKDMENHDRIANLETKYFQLKLELRTYSPITDSPEMFLLILLLVFPFVIYLVYKGNQKRSIEENNMKIHQQMDEVLKEVEPLI